MQFCHTLTPYIHPLVLSLLSLNLVTFCILFLLNSLPSLPLTSSYNLSFFSLFSPLASVQSLSSYPLCLLFLVHKNSSTFFFYSFVFSSFHKTSLYLFLHRLLFLIEPFFFSILLSCLLSLSQNHSISTFFYPFDLSFSYKTIIDLPSSFHSSSHSLTEPFVFSLPYSHPFTEPFFFSTSPAVFSYFHRTILLLHISCRILILSQNNSSSPHLLPYSHPLTELFFFSTSPAVFSSSHRIILLLSPSPKIICSSYLATFPTFLPDFISLSSCHLVLFLIPLYLFPFEESFCPIST